jgi:diaminobutyrate-2-oxoglutarate transaminase
MGVFEELESEVRSYCRNWPVVFDRASGSWLYDEAGRPYLDFFSGAGALNYGHNHPYIKERVLEYLAEDRIVHSLDMYTRAKQEFLETLNEVILKPRALDYRVQFPGPAGTNAVEAAMKLVRKVTGRTDIVCFSGGFHGMSLGALAATENPSARAAAGVPLDHTIRIPYDEPGGLPDLATLDLLFDSGRAPQNLPAGVIVETVQGEGGVRPARLAWLRALSLRCRDAGIPLIVDDVQMGCGRTGPFFSFEPAGIIPDVVCLSKSLSGYGLPLALTLIRQDLDVWEPGEHNGTFRGFNPALIAATAALNGFWRDRQFEQLTTSHGRHVRRRLAIIAREADEPIDVRGRGMANGLVFETGQRAKDVAAYAFQHGLLVERSGPEDEVVKLLAPLTTSQAELDQGLEILAEAVRAVALVHQ